MGTVREMIAKPFKVAGVPVPAQEIADTIDALADVPNHFVASELAWAIMPGATYHQKQEALNRLFQRWRKLGLVTFEHGRWRLQKGAWHVMQTAAADARREG